MSMPSTSNQSAGFIVSDFKRIQKKNLRGIFTLSVPSGLRFVGCTLHEKGDSWIGLPAQSYVTDDGVKKYKPVVEFTDKTARDRFQAAALEAIGRLREGA